MSYNTTFGSAEGENATSAGSNFRVEISDTVLAVCEALHITTLCVTVWLLVCLIVYGTKARRWNVKTDAGKMHVALFIAVAVSLPRSLGILFLYLAPSFKGVLANCELIMDISYGFGNITLMCNYVFLWLRQRAIYVNPFMKAITAKWVSFLSIGILVYVVASSTALFFFFLVPDSYESEPSGCIIKVTNDEMNMIRAMALLACATFGQITLFLLFVYPMVKVKMAQRGNQMQSGKDPIIDTIKRTTICAAIVVASDFAAVIISITVLSPVVYTISVSEPIFSIKFIITLFTLLATFENYAEILTACCRKIEVSGGIGRVNTQYTQSHYSSKIDK